MMQSKHEWRTNMKLKINEIRPEEKALLDQQILNRLYTYEPYNTAETIGLTVAMKGEINTKEIIEKAWTDGKRVAVPKCNPKTKQMTFHYLTEWDQLEKVYFGLEEPHPDKTALCPSVEIDLLLVPGLIFDRHGFRIGFGGGYYDRYLKRYTNSTVSLAYEFQLVEKVPTETFDLPVQAIITNDRIVNIV
ncbi:5-formyltetrahydrofolate cyclo-ligase [Pseudalkalibacillus hwajinpoensis]|uniref:5-formyltetrahydrofolate cyclo-ligase n=1 Tax=Guptibacillus hwajinpoensis TaxID=208199 RepID=UPI001CFC79B3|nr:5-formyltetrahydrofolate cyclo-ligase [Pseudalkalibacillus hwajinpoensis]